MDITIQGRNITLSESTHEYIEEKVMKLTRYLPDLSGARVEAREDDTRRPEDRYTVQITAWLKGRILRAEESTGSLTASVDAAVEKLRRQVKRVKIRRQRRREGEIVNERTAPLAVELEEWTDGADDVVEEEAGRIVRRKQFVAQMMDEYEALEQMELLGHDFFLYCNPQSRRINLIYKRHDGNYGVLEPLSA